MFTKHFLEKEEKDFQESIMAFNEISKTIDYNYENIKEIIATFLARYVSEDMYKSIYKKANKKEYELLKDKFMETLEKEGIPLELKEFTATKIKRKSSRINLLETMILLELIDLTRKKNKSIDKLLNETYKRNRNDNYLNIASGIYVLDKTNYNKILTSFNGTPYYRRLWENTLKMNKKINQELQNNFLKNDFVDIDKMVDKFSTIDKNNILKVIQYENRAIAEKSNYDYALENKAIGFKFKAVLDSKTTEICKAHHDKVFPMEAFEIGVTVPPLHINCRSTIVYIYKENEEGEEDNDE